MRDQQEILLASGNPKKAAELSAMLEPFELRVVQPADVGGLPEVDEDQPTFAGNAAKKAISAAQASGRIALADDSGLCVDALDGAPGVYSARYSGIEGDGPEKDSANNSKLLVNLETVAEASRGAHFVCALCVANPAGEVLFEADGKVQGRILREPQGTQGFGYDPLFQIDEPGAPLHGRVMAELTATEKASISHRGRALTSLADQLASAHPNSLG